MSNDLIQDKCFAKATFQSTKAHLIEKYKKDNKGKADDKYTPRTELIIDKQKKQNSARDINLRILLNDILNNPQDYAKIFDARQIYLLKGSSMKIKDCRPITIQSSVIKMIENLALKHIEVLKSKGLVKDFDISQCGFQRDRSTQINITRTIAII